MVSRGQHAAAKRAGSLWCGWHSRQPRHFRHRQSCHDTLDGGSSTEDDADGSSGDQFGFSFYGGYGPGSTARDSGVVATAPAPSPRRITLEEYHARLAARGTLDDGFMLRHWRPALAMTRKETGVVRFLKVRVRRPWVALWHTYVPLW